MAMEAPKLRFVRCPKCVQLLVEYPSIPVYQCGGCGTTLRAKHRVIPVAQASSESVEHNNFRITVEGSHENNKLILSDEKRLVSVDQPPEVSTDGIISSTINNYSSRESATLERPISIGDCATPAEHQKEETVVEGNVQNPGFTVKNIHDEGTGGNYNSNLIEEAENPDGNEHANDSKVDIIKVDIIDASEVSTMYENTEVVQREERPKTYECVHVGSHEALIEELERSLPFSSDDEYFSDEAEHNGLSDSLQYQMGSRRYILRGKMDDTSRSDPHGRLIKELEMSFSDVEEPSELHAAVADSDHGNKHDERPQTLAAQSADPCKESLSLFDHGQPEQISSQENRLIGSGNQGKGDIENDNIAASYVHGNDHNMIANVNIAEILHEKQHGIDEQSADLEIADPFEGGVSSVDDGTIKFRQDFQPDDLTADATQAKEEACVEDDINNHVHGINNLVSPDQVIANRLHVNEELTSDHSGEAEEGHKEDRNMANCLHGNAVVANDHMAERIDKNEQCKGLQSFEAVLEHPCEGSVSSVGDRNINVQNSFQPNDVAADDIQEKQGCMEDPDITNYVYGIENQLFSDVDISEKVHGNEELIVDHVGENEESYTEDDNIEKYVSENENASFEDEHIGERVNNEQGKDLQSLEAESKHLCERAIPPLDTGVIRSEQTFQPNERTADGTIEKEGGTEDEDITNCAHEDSAAVASFSSLPNKRTQDKLSSFNKNKEMPCRYRAGQLRQGLSLDSEDFKSIRNFMESQMDGTLSSVSSGSPTQGDLVRGTSNRFNNILRSERLKKMDELRDQLSRLSSQKGSEKRYQKRDLGYQQQSDTYDVEQYLQSLDVDSVPSSCALESYYGHGVPPRYQPPNHFSPTNAYTRNHFGDAQTRIPHNHDAWEFNPYYQSTYESTILDHESFKSSFKEPKRVVRKHILRPLSGASPFTICSSCFNLVQMPSDIYISKAKIGRMQCARCSKVLVLSFPAANQADAKIRKHMAQQSNKLHNNVVTKNVDTASHSAECLTGCHEDFGVSLTRSFSTEAGPSFTATQSGKKVSDSALHRLMGYDTASQLLRDSRVFEDGYESFESMVPVSSRVSRRKNM